MRSDDGVADFMQMFSDEQAVARYTEWPRRFVPGLDALHRMTGLLLAEQVPAEGRVLVLGAGGGLELRALAEMYPGWRFVGIDPAGPMLRLAEQTLGAFSERVELLRGTIDVAPNGPFDGAVYLLTLHFLGVSERTYTVAEIHRRLRPGAPFVAAHGSFTQAEPARSRWLDRYEKFAVASGADPDQAATSKAAIAAGVAMLDPEEDIAVLRAGGFGDVEQFYAAFTWRGWIGHA